MEKKKKENSIHWASNLYNHFEILLTLFLILREILRRIFFTFIVFLRCWVLSLVDVGMKMHIKVVRKRLHCLIWKYEIWNFTLLLKSDIFLIFFSLLKAHSKGLGLLQIFCILICLIDTLVLHNLSSKN